MSLITQCPACATLFKVVPDQLRISEGWVRCGQCDEVFDANTQMVHEVEADIGGEPDETPPKPLVEDHSAQDADVFEPEADAEPEAEQNPGSDIEPPLVEEERETPDPILDKSPHELAHFPALTEVELQTDDVALPVSGQNERIEPRLEHLLGGPPITFVPLGDPTKTASRFFSTSVLVLLAGLLISALVLQWLVKERDRLAAMDVGLQPVLQAVCGVLGCQVGSLRQMDAIVIESSSFVKVRNDTFRLNFVLKSGVQLPLMIPAMELTLTDAQDQPVLRKVILASEFGVVGETLSPGSEAVVSIPLTVKTASSSDRVAGYRLLAFYP